MPLKERGHDIKYYNTSIIGEENLSSKVYGCDRGDRFDRK
ncbi:unnamed protein product [marine sediment metagenome]|uniref:Uncharacterized protein n=1 Tax=marine sediment metagenome TaxID=412755 RepID=X0WJX5_9ZZZZ